MQFDRSVFYGEDKTMGKSLTCKAIKVYLAYVLIACLAAAGAYAGGIVFRQYLRIGNKLILTVGLLAILLIWNREIPAERKKTRITAKSITVAAVVLVLLGSFLQVFIGIDQESVILKDGEKKIEVECSWILLLERSYYNYENIFWYAKEPHFTEHYDDGSPDQYIYTDYYNEDGVYTGRIFKDGEVDWCTMCGRR